MDRGGDADGNLAPRGLILRGDDLRVDLPHIDLPTRLRVDMGKIDDVSIVDRMKRTARPCGRPRGGLACDQRLADRMNDMAPAFLIGTIVAIVVIGGWLLVIGLIAMVRSSR